MSAIFLSAGIPNDPDYANSADPMLIREAVVALVCVASLRGDLVFGGHPAISPLVEHAARSLGTLNRIFIFQSDHYRAVVPTAALAFPNLRWTRDGGTAAGSLTTMRTEMVAFRKYDAAVFIGGQNGLEEEFHLFRASNPTAQVLPIASTGGYTATLFGRNVGPANQATRDALANQIRYRALFRKILY